MAVVESNDARTPVINCFFILFPNDLVWVTVNVMLIVGIEDDSYASVLLCSCDDFLGGEDIKYLENG